jgi:hypothetical protein
MIEEKPDGVLRRIFIGTVIGCLSLGMFLSCSHGTDTPIKPGETPVFGEYSTGLIKDPKRAFGVMHFCPKHFEAPLQAEYDVEKDGGKTPVRNQGSCGSCWAFGGTQTFEIGMQKFGGKTIDFSEQDLVGKLFYGCGGGYFTGEFQTKTGQAEEKDCKYQASNYKCPASVKPVAKALNWGLVGQPNRSPTDQELQTAILAYGSVAATVGANNAFGNLKGDHSTSCPSSGTNHIVTLVGWRTIDGKIYFKVKNSWDTTWGNAGYMYIPRGCWNLAEEASWLAVDAVPCQPPKVHLAKEVILNYGDEVRFAVKPETGVTYSWYRNGVDKLADGPVYDHVARESMVLMLKAQNQCGSGEVISMITVPQN